jgi:mono/diheme cytochrome c family protein
MTAAILRRPIVRLTAPALVVLLVCPGARAADPAAVRVYRTTCLKCHDTDGKGEIVRDVMSKVPDFTDAAWHATRTDAELGRSILEGKGKSMPAMRNKLGGVDVAQMVAFVRGFRDGKQVVEEEEEKPAEPAPARPAAPAPVAAPGPTAAAPRRPGSEDAAPAEASRIFRRSCVACHGAEGRGDGMRDSLPSIPDFSARAWQETRTDAQLLVSVLDGKGTGMPPFRDKVSREQARGLVALVRSMDPAHTQAARGPSDDFEAKFQQLLAEFEELRRQSRALSGEAAPARLAPPSAPPTPRNEDQPRGDGRPGPGG